MGISGLLQFVRNATEQVRKLKHESAAPDVYLAGNVVITKCFINSFDVFLFS